MRVRNVDPYRGQLIQLARSLQTEIRTSEELPQAGNRSLNRDLKQAHLHLADLDADNDSTGSANVSLECDHHLLDEVQSALRRIDDGEFGECECCHESINTARLRVVPYARYCIHCAFELESKLDSHSALYEEFDVVERKSHDLQSVFATVHDDDLWDRKIRRRRKRLD